MGTDQLKKSDKKVIYLSIDHLKKGTYSLRITLKNKVVKSFNFKKDRQEDAINRGERKGGH